MLVCLSATSRLCKTVQAASNLVLDEDTAAVVLFRPRVPSASSRLMRCATLLLERRRSGGRGDFILVYLEVFACWGCGAPDEMDSYGCRGLPSEVLNDYQVYETACMCDREYILIHPPPPLANAGWVSTAKKVKREPRRKPGTGWTTTPPGRTSRFTRSRWRSSRRTRGCGTCRSAGKRSWGVVEWEVA